MGNETVPLSRNPAKNRHKNQQMGPNGSLGAWSWDRLSKRKAKARKSTNFRPPPPSSCWHWNWWGAFTPCPTVRHALRIVESECSVGRAMPIARDPARAGRRADF